MVLLNKKTKEQKYTYVICLPFLELLEPIEVLDLIYCPLKSINLFYDNDEIKNTLKEKIKTAFGGELSNPTIIFLKSESAHSPILAATKEEIKININLFNMVKANASIICHSLLYFSIINNYLYENFLPIAIETETKDIIFFPDFKPLLLYPAFISKQKHIMGEEEKKLINSLGDVVVTANLEKDKNQILRAIDWFNLASSSINDEQQILFLGIAFEALLNTPSENIKNYILNLIGILALEAEKQVKKWVDDFYKIRSKIVHGEKIIENDLIFSLDTSLFDIGRGIFAECLISRLVLMRVISDDKQSMILRQMKIKMRLESNKDKLNKAKNILKKSNIRSEDIILLFKITNALNPLDKTISKKEIENLIVLIKKSRKKVSFNEILINTITGTLSSFIENLEYYDKK